MGLTRLLAGTFDLPVQVMTDGTVRISDRFLLWKKDLRVSLDTNRVTLSTTGPLGTTRVQTPLEEVRVTVEPSAITVGSQGASIPCFEGTVWVADRNLIVSKRGDKGRVLTYLRALNAQLANRLTIEEHDSEASRSR